MSGCQASQDAESMRQERENEEPSRGRHSKDRGEAVEAASIGKVVCRANSTGDRLAGVRGHRKSWR